MHDESRHKTCINVEATQEPPPFRYIQCPMGQLCPIRLMYSTVISQQVGVLHNESSATSVSLLPAFCRDGQPAHSSTQTDCSVCNKFLLLIRT